MNSPACAFCAIAAGDQPATVVRRWPDAVAIVPLSPVVNGHTLVIPTTHVQDFTSDPEVTGLVMQRAAEIAPHPSNLITSAGVEATQTVYHLHAHIVPRADGDGLSLPWPSPEGFTCPRCGRTSHHPTDRAEGYCGACHDWTGRRA